MRGLLQFARQNKDSQIICRYIYDASLDCHVKHANFFFFFKWSTRNIYSATFTSTNWFFHRRSTFTFQFDISITANFHGTCWPETEFWLFLPIQSGLQLSLGMDFFLPGDTPNVNWYNTNLSLFVSSQFKMLASFEWNLFSIFTFCTLHTKNNFFRSFRLKRYFITESIHLICKRYPSNILLVLHLKQFYLCLWHYNSISQSIKAQIT